MSRALRWFLGVLVLLSGLLLALTLERVAERGRFARAFSSYGSGPEGVRALYLLAHELGFTPMRWSQDLARLPPAATLLALGDCASGMARPMSRYERDELLRWLADGGVLLVAGTRHYLPAGLGVEFEVDPNCPDGLATPDDGAQHTVQPPPAQPIAGRPLDSAADGGVVVFDPSGTSSLADGSGDEAAQASDAEPRWGVPMDKALRGLPIVPFREPGRLTLSSERADTLLGVPTLDRVSSTTSLLPLAASVPYGRGRVIVLAAANMFQNAELETSEGAPLFARLMQSYGRGGPLLFDEYHMGLGERRSLMQYLRQLGAMPALFQLLLCVVVLLWRAGARFGGLRTAPEPPAGGTTSFVTALGGLYQGAGDAAAALRLIARAALARIAAHHGMGAMQAAPLERALEERGAVQARDAVRAIVAAVSSTRKQPLQTVVQGIDAAVANATVPVRSTATAASHVGVRGWLPARKR
jgi:hypothetical protein